MSFFWKLFLCYATGILVIVTTVSVAAIWNLKTEAEAQIREEPETMLQFIGALISANPEMLSDLQLAEHLDQITEESGFELLIIRTDGSVFVDTSEAFVEREDEFLEIPGLRQEFKQIDGESLATDHVRSQEMFYFTAPVLSGEHTMAYIRIGYRAAELARQVSNILLRVSLAGAGGALVCRVFGWMITKRLTRPLALIDDGGQRILRGDLDYKVQLRDSDEMGRVATTINSMTQELGDRVRLSTLQRNRMELILQSLQDAVLMVDRAGMIIFFNTAAGEFLQVYDQEWPFTLGKHAKLEGLRSEILKRMDDLQSSTVELSWTDESADRRYAELFIAPLDAARHDTEGLLCVIRDHTESRRFEELRRAFASNVSHELKTPICAIGALLETIEAYEQMPVVQRSHFLHRIRHQNDRMLRLVNELLALSKLESGSQILDLALCDLRQVCEAVENTFILLAEKRNISLIFDYKSNEELTAVVDATALEIILNSLLDNALRHGPRAGWVRLEVERLGDAVEFRISDNGPGIPPDAQPRIFERFFRVEASRSRDRGGSGMGLAIVKHLVQAHGGSIDLVSSNRAGTSFRISLPCNLKAEAAV